MSWRVPFNVQDLSILGLSHHIWPTPCICFIIATLITGNRLESVWFLKYRMSGFLLYLEIPKTVKSPLIDISQKLLQALHDRNTCLNICLWFAFFHRSLWLHSISCLSCILSCRSWHRAGRLRVSGSYTEQLKRLKVSYHAKFTSLRL